MNDTLQGRSAGAARRVRPVPAVSRAIAILRLLGSSPEPMGVKAIAQSLGLVTSTCLHILRVLVDEQLVRVDPGTKRYSLGVGMLLFARKVLESTRFPSLVQPTLDGLSTAWSITAIGVQIASLDHMVVLALSRSSLPFSLHVDVGSRFPALISATGRLVAAFGGFPRKEVEARFRSLRWHRSPDLKTWRREIESARRDGYSIDRGNYIAGVTLIAAPVRDAQGVLTHTLVAAGMVDQLKAGHSVALAKQMCAEARRIADLLSSRGDRP